MFFGWSMVIVLSFRMEVFAFYFGINDGNGKLIRRTEILPLLAADIDTILQRQPINTVKNRALKVINIKENKVYRKSDLFTINLVQRPGLADSIMLQDAFTVAFRATFAGTSIKTVCCVSKFFITCKWNWSLN